MNQPQELERINLIEPSAEDIEIVNKYTNEIDCDDPLAGYGDQISPQYYRVDCVVFAEPVRHWSTDNKVEEEEGTLNDSAVITLNENVTIRKSSTKGKKLFVQLKDQSNLDCPVPNCLKTFTTPTLLRSHIRKVHFSDKRYTCEVCGASFTAMYLLKRHAVVHKEARTQCPVCKKMLSLRTNLTQHLRSHADTRRHQCPVCRKRFLRSSTLKVHRENAHQD